MGRLLLRNGDVIDTEPEPRLLRGVDVLVEDGRIVAVQPDLPLDGAECLDATDRIVLPGFVDTHRHVWQAVLRSAAVDDDLGSYLERIRGQYGPRMRPADVYASNLAGALECLDSGITTVQDFSHIQYTPEHSDAAVTALRAAGIRAVFGYGYPAFDDRARRPAEVRRVREQYFSTEQQLLTMALTPLGPSYSQVETVDEDWRLARELDLPIAMHVGSGPISQRPITTLDERGLLVPGTVYVHGNSLGDDQLRLIAASGGGASVAPAVEAQMGHGPPVIGRLREAGVVTGLGVDVVTTVAGDMFSLMRAALMSSQLGEGPRLMAADVLRMATLDGAEVLGAADRVGSLRPGKQADIVVLRTDTPNLVAAGWDPIGAVATAAHPGNVETVLVAGEVVKRAGALVHADLTAAMNAARDAAAHLATDR